MSLPKRSPLEKMFIRVLKRKIINTENLLTHASKSLKLKDLKLGKGYYYKFDQTILMLQFITHNDVNVFLYVGDAYCADIPFAQYRSINILKDCSGIRFSKLIQFEDDVIEQQRLEVKSR